LNIAIGDTPLGEAGARGVMLATESGRGDIDPAVGGVPADAIDCPVGDTNEERNAAIVPRAGSAWDESGGGPAGGGGGRVMELARAEVTAGTALSRTSWARSSASSMFFNSFSDQRGSKG